MTDEMKLIKLGHFNSPQFFNDCCKYRNDKPCTV